MMVSNLLNFPTWDQWDDRISKCLISDFETTNGQPMVWGRERGWHWRWGAPHPLQGRTIAWEGDPLSTEISWPYFEGIQFWKYASTMLWRYPILKWFDPIWPNRYMCFSCVFPYRRPIVCVVVSWWVFLMGSPVKVDHVGLARCRWEAATTTLMSTSSLPSRRFGKQCHP